METRNYLRRRQAKKRRRKLIIRRIIAAAVLFVAIAAVVALAVWLITAFINRNTDTKPQENPAQIEEQAETVPAEPETVTTDPPEGSEEIETVAEPAVEKETVVLTEDDVKKGILILVNRNHPFAFTAEYELIDLFTYKSSAYKFRDDGMMFAPFAGEKLNEMLVDFYNRTGIGDINIISAFRDIETQQRIYNSRLEYYNGNVETTEKWVALPGASEHHTGLAVDFGIYTSDGESYDYDGKGEYAWINENCWKYGFIVRYDSAKTDITGIAYEPWHFRYLGLPHAEIISHTDFCYEEYIAYLKAYPQNGEHLFFTSYTGEKYEIFFVRSEGEKTEIKIEKGADYFISGNNDDGFIVTVTLHDNS